MEQAIISPFLASHKMFKQKNDIYIYFFFIICNDFQAQFQ